MEVYDGTRKETEDSLLCDFRSGGAVLNTIYTLDQKDYSEEKPLTERYAVRA